MEKRANLTDDLLNAFIAADPVAEKLLFNSFYKPLCFYGEKMVHDLGQAQDIATEAVLQLMHKRSNFSSMAAIRSFLFRCVHNAALNHIAAKKNHTRIKTQIAYLSPTTEGLNDPSEAEILRAELLFEIYEEMNFLPGRCGEIFKMLFVNECTTQEVATHFEINIQTVRSQKARAIQLLKSALKKKNRLVALQFLSVWGMA